MSVTSAPPLAGPHTHAPTSVGGVMMAVMIALLPATGFGIYLFGWPALNTLLLCLLGAIAAEAFSLLLARKPVAPFLFDGSAVLTGWLLALSLPPWAPWWISVLGSAFAIIIGKQVFGGVGQNVFNPAMLARVALLISFPVEMTSWVLPQPLFSATAPGFLDSLGITFLSVPPADSVSSASILGHVKTELGQGHALSQALAGQPQTLSSFLGMQAGSLGETSSVLLLLGGLYLLVRRVISWHIPVAMLGAAAALAAVFHLLHPEQYAGPLYHLFSGGMMLGAFFIATDLVTSPTTRRGQLLFGAGCGALDYVIRTWGGYPEGIGFAVLLMNAFTPLIDHYIRPRVYGRTRSGRPLEYAKAKTRNEVEG